MILDWVLYAAFLAGLAGVTSGAMHLRGHAPARAWMRWSLTTATALVLAAFAGLVALFILVRTDIEYVFLYTSDAIPLRYRIAGAWAGREGSLLLWTVYAAAVAAAVSWWQHRHPPEGRSRVWTELVLAGIATAFLGAVMSQGTFDATSAFFLQQRPNGNGLNPTLLNPFILIHPPVMFLAYALTAVPLAAVIADQITGEQSWSSIGLLWSRIDWLLYTFAMGLGGIWAYYTLGFGGYWAWDPVEVANLLPWLALTVFLHAQLHHLRYGRYRHLGPFLGMLPFLFTLFSTISTRSGLWVSVHAFTDPTDTFDPDAARRFLDIMAREPSLHFHVGLMLTVTTVFLALWARRLALDTGHLPRMSRIVAGLLGAFAVAAAFAPRAATGLLLEGAARIVPGHIGFGLLAITALAVLLPAAPMFVGESEQRKLKLDLVTLGMLSIAVLGIGLLVIFLWHIGAVNGWSTDAYIERFPVLATPVLLGLMLLQGHGIHGKQMLWYTGGLWLTALVAAWLLGAAAYLLVLTVALVAISIHRVLVAGAWKVRTPRERFAAAALWLAALLDVVFWLNPPTVRLGIITWTPAWPTQLIFGAAAFLALHLATLVLAGRARHVGRAHWLAGLLGGFYIAGPLALAAWLVHRRSPRGVSSPRPRLHQIGLYGTHLAVALVLLGYVTTTYLGTQEDQTWEPGETALLGGSAITLLGTDSIVDGARTERFLPTVEVDGATVAQATLYWEDQTGSHYPLPATARMWDRDVYFAVDAVCIDPSGGCERSEHWIQAYEPGIQLPAGMQVTDVQVQAFTLPGIALVWAGLFVFLHQMAVMMMHAPQRS